MASRPPTSLFSTTGWAARPVLCSAATVRTRTAPPRREVHSRASPIRLPIPSAWCRAVQRPAGRRVRSSAEPTRRGHRCPHGCPGATGRGDIQQSLSYSGDIRAREQISVLPKSTGRIEKVLVDVGSRVNAGDTLAVLEQDSAEIAVLQARATLAGAEAKLATLQAGPR